MGDVQSAGAPAQDDDTRSASSYPKQAIVVIHGMGEQIPMDTLKGFVRTVWETDKDLFPDPPPGKTVHREDPSEVWSKPDLRTGLLELRRIMTRPTGPTSSAGEGLRCDFYELYWADLSGGSTVAETEDWIVGLLWRSPFTRIPRNVLLAWSVLWIATLFVLVLAIATALPKESTLFGIGLWHVPPLSWLSSWQKWALATATAALGFAMNYFVVPYFGHVVRYTRAKPENIAARTAIRERGLKLLADIQKDEYDRIIVVGHSLGAILAYDLISYFWATRYASHTLAPGTDEFEALCALERAAAALASAATKENIAAYRDAQRAFGDYLRKRPAPKQGETDTRWLITDLITLGSPLGHAEFLLARDKRDLKSRINGREFPIAPPVREVLDARWLDRARGDGLPTGKDWADLLCFPFVQDARWQLHHAAPFAATRWTNIHDPARFIFCGDIVSSPAAPVFGPAVVDIDLRARRKLRGQRAQSLGFTHTLYWSWSEKGKPPVRVEELRKALDLRR